MTIMHVQASIKQLATEVAVEGGPATIWEARLEMAAATETMPVMDLMDRLVTGVAMLNQHAKIPKV